MSWLLKDPINSGLAQFDHAQSNSKKCPKGEKDQIAPNQFFSWKTTNKFSCTYWPFSLCKILKNFLGPIQSFEMCHFWTQNSQFVPNKIFFGKKLLISFSSTYWSLSFCKIFKKFFQWIQSYFPKWEFFLESLLMRLVSFIHAYLHAKIQSKKIFIY